MLERKSRLSEPVLSLISGVENMRIGAVSNIVSLNIGPSEKHFRVLLSLITCFYQHMCTSPYAVGHT